MQFDDAAVGQPSEYLTPAQVSLLLQIPQTTLAVWRSTGRVRLAYFKIGHAVRYRRADIDRLLEANSHRHESA